MKSISYFLMKIKYRLFHRNKEIISNFFRKQGMLIGEKCNIVSNISTTEAYLISIGNNTTISANVTLITHDNSVSKVVDGSTDLFGRIIIGDNCFIGNGAMILYGVSIQNNTIVAAGSVVTKSFKEENIIIGGNPARIIGRWEDFKNKYTDNCFNLNDISRKELKKTILESKKLIEK